MSTIASEHVLRPLRHLPWRRIAAGNAAMFLPATAVVIALGIPAGHVLPVVVWTVITVAAICVIVLPAVRIRTALDHDGLTKHGASLGGPTRIRRDAVRSAVVRTVYNGDGVTTYRHLFLLDGAGRSLLRMSTRWWTEEQLLAVAHHVGAPLETRNQPVNLSELRHGSRRQLRWAERHAITAAGIGIAIGLVGCLLLAQLATAAVA